MAKKEFKTMNETKRTIFTGLVIGLLTLAIPFYLQLIGVVPSGEVEEKAEEIPEKIVKKLPLKAAAKQTKEKKFKKPGIFKRRRLYCCYRSVQGDNYQS